MPRLVNINIAGTDDFKGFRLDCKDRTAQRMYTYFNINPNMQTLFWGDQAIFPTDDMKEIFGDAP